MGCILSLRRTGAPFRDLEDASDRLSTASVALGQAAPATPPRARALARLTPSAYDMHLVRADGVEEVRWTMEKLFAYVRLFVADPETYASHAGPGAARARHLDCSEEVLRVLVPNRTGPDRLANQYTGVLYCACLRGLGSGRSAPLYSRGPSRNPLFIALVPHPRDPMRPLFVVVPACLLLHPPKTRAIALVADSPWNLYVAAGVHVRDGRVVSPHAQIDGACQELQAMTALTLPLLDPATVCAATATP